MKQTKKTYITCVLEEPPFHPIADDNLCTLEPNIYTVHTLQPLQIQTEWTIKILFFKRKIVTLNRDRTYSAWKGKTTCQWQNSLRFYFPKWVLGSLNPHGNKSWQNQLFNTLFLVFQRERESESDKNANKQNRVPTISENKFRNESPSNKNKQKKVKVLEF